MLLTLSTIRDKIDVSNKLNKNVSVISFSFLKVLHRVDWDFIFSALQKLGYEDKFIHMIKVAFTKFESKIKIRGLLSDPFTLI